MLTELWYINNPYKSQNRSLSTHNQISSLNHIIITDYKLTKMISNSNWTEWSTIQGVIRRVISNRQSAKSEANLKLQIIEITE